MEKVKVGIIGAGGIVQFAYLPAYQKMEEAEVVAISDVNETKLKEVAKKFDVPRFYTNYQDLLKEEEIEAVNICTPNFLHAEQAIASLKAGKHVLCEKPVAINVPEAERILEEVERSGKKFMVGFCHRFGPPSRSLRKFIDRGELGEIYYAKASYLRRRGIPGLGGWFTTKKLSGGGPLIDVGVHILDLSLWFMGSPEPQLVVGSTYNKFKDQAVDGGWPPLLTRKGDKFTGTFDVEDLASAFIKFENGSTLFLEASWAGNSETGSSISLFGTKGGAKMSLAAGERFPGELTIYKEEDGDLVDIHPRLSTTDPYQDELSHFIRCIKEDKQPITKPEEILNVVKIIEAIYCSAEKGKAIELQV
ncbi:gfo/Idh/MocA family oxidoreductase [Candidatus Aerophobetes bacterium]|uniref:Gfo/Idh/MocA family oxidoreductase n=1 Tax=Aerophobetes bacterium TaxID=2030807 RepID=A0A497E3M7_UNCAE|nr:MAG: gfo/Idh/MocA family oxidoreductase [Candidatus Aerophobetes bacterium]